MIVAAGRVRRPASACPSGELTGDLAREELHVPEIGHVENLKVDPLDAGFDERTKPVDDFRGRADEG